jgi:hypothetical protein
MKKTLEYNKEEVESFLRDYFIEARLVHPYDDFDIEFIVAERTSGPMEHSLDFDLVKVKVTNNTCLGDA